MTQKPGRNDPCPCGSGKKYKNCCFSKDQPKGKKKFTASKISGTKPVDLMERAFGAGISKAKSFEKPALPPHSKTEDDRPVTM